MKKLLIIFSVLVLVFMGIWVIKAKTPADKPNNNNNQSDNAWWNNSSDLPVADSDWILDPEIPGNYIPVPGEDELYMVVEEDGKITEYRHREKQEDGSWLWETVNPDIPDNYEAVDGLENIYKVTDKNGTVSYYKYIRNEDDTFAFVPVDKDGNELKSDKPSGTEIPDNYIRISGNIYAVYDENGVVIGYKERTVDKDGNYQWVTCEKPVATPTPTPNATPSKNNTATSTIKPTPSVTIKPSTVPSNIPGGQIIAGSDGTFTQTETIISTETKGGWVITYQTVVTRKYDSKGTLLSTKKEGPTEISRVKATDSSGDAPDTSKIQSTLTAELARVSVGLKYETELAKAVLAEINAERIAANIGTLGMTDKSNATLLAKIRSADMAIYNHSDYDSPMYGTLAAMCQRFNVKSAMPSEILWKTTADKTASSIAARLKIMSNDTLTNKSYQTIGISIVSKGGYYYVDVVLV